MPVSPDGVTGNSRKQAQITVQRSAVGLCATRRLRARPPPYTRPPRQSLLCDPNLASPANPEAASMLSKNPKEYKRRVRRLAEKSCV